MSLTANQKETMHAIVQGSVGGMIAKPIPSLIKRGLVVETVENVFQPAPVAVGIRSTGAGRTFPRTVYRLTKLGAEEYTKFRTKWHAERVKKLETEFQRDLARAKPLEVPSAPT